MIDNLKRIRKEKWSNSVIFYRRLLNDGLLLAKEGLLTAVVSKLLTPVILEKCKIKLKFLFYLINYSM